jgi:hypothetical protein
MDDIVVLISRLTRVVTADIAASQYRINEQFIMQLNLSY